MDSEHGGDRLSTLPDDLIFKILSLVGFRQAIETSALSSRWRYLWTSMPYLRFSDEEFHTLAKFSKFVKGVLSGQNNQTDVSSVNFTIRRRVSGAFVKGILNKVLNYALSHNVQQLNIVCLDGDMSASHFTSQSLKTLTLNGFTYYKNSITTPSTWKLLALTTLNLRSVTLYNGKTDKSAGLFSNCANLKNLTLNNCNILGSTGFNISHPGLSNLTLIRCEEGVNVFTPQLKNLTIDNWGLGIHLISAPNLTSLQYEGDFSSLQLSTDSLHLEEVGIRIYHPFGDKANAHKIVCLFQKLDSVKFLTLDFDLVKEVRAMNNTKLAQELITELRALLKHENASMETKMVKMDEPGKAHIDIESCWKHLSVQIEKEKEKASDIISKLNRIKKLLGELPASNRATIRPSFSTLCAEADHVMNKITDCVKTDCDENQRLLSACFNELAITFEPSS